MQNTAKLYENDEILIARMKDNNNGLPIFMRKYYLHDSPSPLHMHEMIQINYIAHGRAHHTINETTHELVKGDIFVIPPYVPHRLSDCGDSKCQIIELEFLPEFILGKHRTMERIESVFDFAYIEPFLVSECDVRPRLNLSGKTQVTVENMLDNMFDEYNMKKTSFLLALKALVLQLLVYVGRLFKENIEKGDTAHLFERHRAAIASAISYIDENFNEDISIEKISRIAMLSQSYFSYLFKSMTNKTFVEYLTELRLNEAMKMLRNTNKRVVDICFETGFKNVNHFNRTFKNYVGISPTQYRHGEE